HHFRQLLRVPIGEAHAAVRFGFADPLRRRRAVDAVTVAEIDPGRADRILGAGRDGEGLFRLDALELELRAVVIGGVLRHRTNAPLAAGRRPFLAADRSRIEGHLLAPVEGADRLCRFVHHHFVDLLVRSLVAHIRHHDLRAGGFQRRFRVEPAQQARIDMEFFREQLARIEPRVETEGNADQQSTCRAQSRISVSQALERIRKVARERKKERFTALFHHISIDLLEEAFYELKEDAAPGVDRLTWTDYEADLACKLEDLHDRVQRGAYRALPSRRVYIPKPDGRQRPLAVAALEDKIVQRAVAALLNAIYEEEVLGVNYGFRPGRGAHDALDALCVGIHGKKVSFILDADIRSFFDEISQQWLIRFLEHRVGDRRIIRLIQKWLKAGILEDGSSRSVTGGRGRDR